MPFQEMYEIAVLRHDDGLRRTGGTEDPLVGRIPKSKLPDGYGGNGEPSSKPACKSGRQLRVDPDGHAAMIG